MKNIWFFYHIIRGLFQKLLIPLDELSENLSTWYINTTKGTEHIPELYIHGFLRAFKVLYGYISIASIRYITLHKNTASLPVVFNCHSSKPSMVLVNSSWHTQKTDMCVEWPAAIPPEAFISYSFTTGLTKPDLDAISKKNSNFQEKQHHKHKSWAGWGHTVWLHSQGRYLGMQMSTLIPDSKTLKYQMQHITNGAV